MVQLDVPELRRRPVRWHTGDVAMYSALKEIPELVRMTSITSRWRGLSMLPSLLVLPTCA